MAIIETRGFYGEVAKYAQRNQGHTNQDIGARCVFF